jgi:NAD(P)H-hydrate repair Nnr-like enzyme with NAD(P)H-hydrate epimerase domain/8-oxo-dGTP pyrophosphatase MutT (NUDIX family)
MSTGAGAGTGAVSARLAAALAAVAESERTPPSIARTAAVLVLLADGPAGPRLVLTRRREDLRSHPGQVALPGGRIEAGESPTAAALREAAEEVGLAAGGVAVLGTGPTFHVPPSRFWIVPVVAWWERPHALRPAPSEVAAVLEVDLVDLRDPSRWRRTPSVGRGRAGWAWRLRSGDLLWGATAVVVRGLLDALDPDWHGGVSPDDLAPDREERPWELAPRAPRRTRLGPLPDRAQAHVPHATLSHVRAVRSALASNGVGADALAARAGAAVAAAVGRLAATGSVTVLAGPSSNGAAGIAAAHVLAAAGREVEVVLAGAPRAAGAVAALAAAGVRVGAVPDGPGAVVVDALLGAAGRPPLAGAPAEMARWLRRHDVPVLAVDVPSGFGAAEGPAGMCVAADATVALGLPLAACALPSAQVFLGDLVVADLGLDAPTWARVGLKGVPSDLFGSGPLVRLSEAAAGGDAGTPLQVDTDPVGDAVRAVGVEPTLGGF